MDLIKEPARETPVVDCAEVLVVGGGTAGVAAAIAAGRTGADVLVVERSGYLGGAATGGLVITLPADRQGPMINEMMGRLQAMKEAAIMDERGWLAFSPEMLKWLAVEMIEKAGGRFLLHSLATSAIVRDGRIQGIIIESKSGRQAVLADVVIDCTGDADIAALANAPFAVGDDNGEMLPVTMMFMALGVDKSKYKEAKVEIPPELRMGRVLTMVHPGELNVWGGRLPGINGVDVKDLTRAENELRKQVVGWMEWMKKNMPGMENSHLSLTAPQLGVRETRRILGEHVLTKEEWDSGKIFDDHIGFAYEGKSVPYRSLLPRDIDGLLVAGRCISTNHEVQDPMRIIPPCTVTGHAAGCAASLASLKNVPPRHLPVETLKEALAKQGVAMG